MIRLLFSLFIFISITVSAGNPDSLYINKKQLFNQHYFWIVPGQYQYDTQPFSTDSLNWNDTITVTESSKLYIRTHKGCRYKAAIVDSSYIFKSDDKTIKIKKKGFTIKNEATNQGLH